MRPLSDDERAHLSERGRSDFAGPVTSARWKTTTVRRRRPRAGGTAGATSSSDVTEVPGFVRSPPRDRDDRGGCRASGPLWVAYGIAAGGLAAEIAKKMMDSS